MLNELLVAERGARAAGWAMPARHRAVKDAGNVPTLLVRLGPVGNVVSVSPIPRDVTPWTIRDGQHNSFPFVKPESPLWTMHDDERRKATQKKNTRRREDFLDVAAKARFAEADHEHWPDAGLMKRLRERRAELQLLDGTEGLAVLAIFDRFLSACSQSGTSKPPGVLQAVADHLLSAVRHRSQDEWLEIAVALLVGRFDAKQARWLSGGGLLFEADGVSPSIVDPILAEQASRALSASEVGQSDTSIGLCALTGDRVALVSDDFPQPIIANLGQTYLFAKNRATPANDRYGTSSAQAMPVGRETADRLAAAARALTEDRLKGVVWRPLPGESPKQSDLLLSFVEGAPDVGMVDAVASDEAEDFANEYGAGTADTDSIAAFEKRTQRLVDAVRARVGADFRRTPVQIIVLRKVDIANRKIVLSGRPAADALFTAASAWIAGERNVPNWLALPVPVNGVLRALRPTHVAPLGTIQFSRSAFIRGGTERQEVIGLPAPEALGLFLDPFQGPYGPARRRVRRVLRLVLSRRSSLLAGTAQIRHTPTSWLRRTAGKRFDHREALRTVTVLGVLLHKLGRREEDFVSDTAFVLGQFLAAADVVHAGYCADVRGGDVPPSLLGNQVLNLAQTSPVKALAVLSRRWKPYDAWAKKAARDSSKASALVSSSDNSAQRRGWDIRTAVRHARVMRTMANTLGESLEACSVNDVFRAELLLGYIAGLPRSSASEREAGMPSNVADEEGHNDNQ